MTQIKKLLINTTNPSIEARDLKLIEAKTGNLYESIAITAKRANQINTKIKDELHSSDSCWRRSSIHLLKYSH